MEKERTRKIGESPDSIKMRMKEKLLFVQVGRIEVSSMHSIKLSNERETKVIRFRM